MYQKYIKRLIDIIFSLIGLIFFLPIFIIIAPIIWLEDKGPIFYNAERLGKNGKIFKMYKFRSMKVNAPDIRNKDGSTYNGNDDPRLTKIGIFIRKTSLDELPQLINVLKGDMSFIGPRPFLNEKFDKKIKSKIEKRCCVRPGITGYSQAYFRNSISQNKKIEKDLYYIANISIIMDFKIMIKTIISVLKKENIYNSKIKEEEL